MQTPALDPASPPPVTVPATNFLPSPLAPVGPTLLVLAALLAVLVWIGWAKLGTRPWARPAALLVVAVCLAGGIALSRSWDDRYEQPGLQAIAAKSLPVSASAAGGRVGVVLNDQGDIAAANVDQGRLEISDLEHAGEYKGSIDLNGAAKGGTAATTVKVRDWWPWAVAAIALGVLAGARVRRWFDRDRPRERLRLRARAVPAQVNAALRETSLVNWVPAQRVTARLDEIERLLETEDTVASPEQEVEALEAYVERTERLRAKVEALQEAIAGYDRIWPALDLGVVRDEIAALGIAENVVGTIFDTADRDPASARLEQAELEVDDALAVIDAASTAASAAHVWMGVVRQALEQPGADTEALAAELLALQARAREIVRARSVDAIEEAYTEASRKASGGRPAPPLQDVVPARPVVERKIDAPKGAKPGNVDDRFRFRLRNAGVSEVVWDFGDQTPARIADPGAWVDHAFAAPGDYTVVASRPDGGRLASTPVAVSGPSRLTGDQRALADRERMFTRIAVALTISSGMLTLYLADPAWGTAEDYVKALLWGAVISEGVAYVAAIVDRTYPAGK